MEGASTYQINKKEILVLGGNSSKGNMTSVFKFTLKELENNDQIEFSINVIAEMKNKRYIRFQSN